MEVSRGEAEQTPRSWLEYTCKVAISAVKLSSFDGLQYTTVLEPPMYVSVCQGCLRNHLGILPRIIHDRHGDQAKQTEGTTLH
jgi:hypothetical protein